ncbi:zinc finger CCCH domain-containing protein 2-like [Impatiens glandulifera]|uniref:zinc finger CCCH domain-containing protein 2-like n=1 Tax=Impatiens glandulifera TaxID=253017 RepID=UPI001FB19183|nr:zinc finger CCCH domain-containing protein 2-like [Impatiens glandulifera]
MANLCPEQHKFHAAHQLLLGKKAFREIDIPPRKLLAAARLDLLTDSPRSLEETALLQKYLPYNGGEDDDEDADPYSSDHFRMYEFKVRRCTRSRSHDWTDCPFAHPGEKARRRDPRRFHYSGTVCADFRRGSCNRGDNCEFAHGVFECWLHPVRYRTEACKDGKNCKRKVCFFAHTPRQLRILPPSSPTENRNPTSAAGGGSSGGGGGGASRTCCAYCHCSNSSPKSTLLGISSNYSPPLTPSSLTNSPPLSPPARTRAVPQMSHFSEHMGGKGNSGMVSELMNSMNNMNLNPKKRLSWVDIDVCDVDENTQFVISPNSIETSPSTSGYKRYSFDEKMMIDMGLVCPDLGWVDDLLT